jgi:FkbM family methyltransferase
MKKYIRQLKKSLFRRHTDYTFDIYILRISSFLLTWLYAFFVLFNTEKRIKFHSESNPVHKFYLKRMSVKNDKLNDDFKKRFLKSDRYDFNGILLPKVNDVTTLRYIYEDVLSIYTEKNDDYNYKIVDEVGKNSNEGSFCYIGPKGEDITIHSNDVVIDAGAWIGDFSAYCAKKGAISYAFEPTESTIELLKKTIKFNHAENFIKIVPFGLGNKEGIINFTNNDLGSANRFDKNGSVQIQVVTLDNWVKENNIKKIDFIKADIEGYERNMLIGASGILKKFQPTLSICTYHLADDPEVLQKIILDINPNYKIIQRKMKLFAYVNKK